MRRAIEPGYGLWVFPGGYVDRGEHIIEAAVREAREESGLDVRIDGLVNIYSYAGTTPIIIVYTATVLGGELCTTTSASKRGCSRRTRSRGTQLAFRSTRDALTDYYSGARPSCGGRMRPARAPLGA